MRPPVDCLNGGAFLPVPSPMNHRRHRRYMNSQTWRGKRKGYFKRHEKKCAACKTERCITLHHMTYENLGRETDADLVPLCQECHTLYHQLYAITSRESTEQFLADYQTREAAVDQESQASAARAEACPPTDRLPLHPRSTGASPEAS